MAFVALCASSLDAQIAARVSRLSALPPYTAKELDGSEKITIQNNAKKTLVALVLSVKHESPDTVPDRDSLNGPLVIFSDPLIDKKATPLQSSEERVITMLGVGVLPPGSFARGTHLLENSILTAGIFADGATTGDPILLGRLLVRRSNMLQAVETAVALLSTAGGHNIPRRQLVEEFQTLADSLNHWYLPVEQRVGRDLYQSIVGRLINLPEQVIGAPFPPTDFVTQQLSSLNQQRTRLLASEPGLQEASALIGR